MNNPNYIPPNLDFFYPDYLHRADHALEGYCPTCESYSNYDSKGCCKDCGTEVIEK